MPEPVSRSHTGPHDVDVSSWIKEIRKGGFKYFVVKAEEFLTCLDEDQVDEFNYMLKLYNDTRADQGKPINSYLVCNRDEPFADEVRSLIFSDEQR